jgi:septal ring factor EnvC (AmiA/AmiB activator)
MKHDELQRMLTDIEISLAKIEVHLADIKADVIENKKKVEATEKRVTDLETFKSKTLGAVSIIVPMVAFLAAIGHDIIKKFMGWG